MADAAWIFQELPFESAVKAINNLQIDFAADLLKQADDHFLKHLAAELDPPLAGALLMHLPEEERVQNPGHPGRSRPGDLRGPPYRDAPDPHHGNGDGPSDLIEQALSDLKSKGFSYTKLPVAAAFLYHSRASSFSSDMFSR